MLHLNLQGLQDREGWEAAGIALPRYDAAAVKARTRLRPVWVHFGAGNIFRAFLAALRKEKGLTQRALADRLYVSDKAVSKWERGVSHS
mgnify:CR=1 FL=1